MINRQLLIFTLFVNISFFALSGPTPLKEIIVDGVIVESMAEAQALIKDGSTIYLGPGIYTTGIHIKYDNVILSGVKGTHFVNAVLDGKAAIITSGNNITIEHIECSRMHNLSGNGACIRHQGENLTVFGVYFHDSEEGILEAHNDGNMLIQFSRFEKLGYEGRAHGIYANGNMLEITNSNFIHMVSQAHSVKSRSLHTVINHCLFTSDKGDDSRLIDIPNGGELVISNSILHQSNTTVNRQVIGYGLEKMGRVRKHNVNVSNNLIIMERLKGNELIALPNWKADHLDYHVGLKNNILIGKHLDQKKWQKMNKLFTTRSDARLSQNELPSVSSLPLLINYLSSL